MNTALLLNESIILDETIINFKNKYFINLQVSKNGKDYPYLKLDCEQLEYDIYDKKNTFKTSLPNLVQVEEQIAYLNQNYDRVYVVMPSSMFSGTFQMIYLQIKDNPKFIMVDTYCIAIDESLVASYIISNLNNNLFVNTADIQNYLRNITGFVVPSDLDFLKRSGKISAIKSVLLSGFDINICISIDQKRETSKIISRGKNSLLGKINHELCQHSIDTILFVHYNLEEKHLAKITKLLKVHCKNLIISQEISFSVKVHFGPGFFSFAIVDQKM